MTNSVALLPNGRQQFFDRLGIPLVGGTVTFYIPGTTTEKDTWQDSAGTILNTNPITLDDLGSAAIWGAGYYRQIVRDIFGNLIWDTVTLAPQIGIATGALFFDTVTDATNANIATGVLGFYVQGYAALGDMGGGLYVLSSGPAAPGKFQSADGQWWILVAQGGVAYPEQFGAKGSNASADGTTNQAAIQNAVNFLGLNGGGQLLFGPYTYYVTSPNRTTNPTTSAPDGHPIVINYSNVTLAGVSKTASVLAFLVFGNLSPASNWQIVDSLVWRGGGIWVQGASSGPGPTGFALKNITLDGGAGYTGNDNFPANTTTGDGWDITHKGVWFEQNLFYQNAEISNCIIRKFRGELVYSGGSNSGELRVSDCTLFSSNGDGISVSFALTAERNEIYDLAFSGLECFFYAGSVKIIDNNIHDCFNSAKSSGNGMSVICGATSTPDIQISQNRIRNCFNGIELTSTVNCSVSLNDIYDCGFASAFGRGIVIFDATGAPIRNTTVEFNHLWADTVNLNNAIEAFETGSAVTENLLIRSNFVAVTALGLSNSVTWVSAEQYAFMASVYPAFIAELSDGGQGVTNTGAALAVVNNVELATTSLTTVAEIQVASSRPVLAAVQVTVKNATTNVLLTALWEIAGPAFPAFTWESGNLTVGTYSFPVQCVVPEAAGFVRINCTASIANNVFVSAQLVQKQ